MTDCGPETSVPDWLIDHPETGPVFRELGIDESCGGKSLEYLCRERGLNVEAVLARLQEVIEIYKNSDPAK